VRIAVLVRLTLPSNGLSFTLIKLNWIVGCCEKVNLPFDLGGSPSGLIKKGTGGDSTFYSESQLKGWIIVEENLEEVCEPLEEGGNECGNRSFRRFVKP
jgi:hypothetical protein